MLLASYQPDIQPVGDSLTASALVAAIPLVTLFVLLGALRITAWISGLVSLGVALVVAVTVYSMPLDQGLLAGSEGAVFGLFPILWIVINAIWIYNLTVATGHFDVLRRSFGKVSDDQRVQAIIIAFCFGALLEALAGFGTPVAITSVMLIALGFSPMKAAVVALVSNTAPVAFGALAVPITTLATITGYSVDELGSVVGRQTPLLALFVPLALVYIIDGRRGVRQVWPAALVCGGAFAVAQFATSNYFSVQLTDIVAALVGALAVVAMLRVWQPAEGYTEQRSAEPETTGHRQGGSAGGSAPGSTAVATATDGSEPDSRSEVARAYAPYLVIIVIFGIAQIGAIKDPLAADAPWFYSIQWPGLDLLTASGDPSTLPTFNINWLGAAGTLLLIAGLVTIPIIKVSPGRAVRTYGASVRQLAAAIVTVMAVLALAYVMNASGQTTSLGNWMAAAGSAFAILSPVLGWLGVAVTGSDTSSNSLFGGLQVAAAGKANLDPVLMAASNSSGGVLGKMISPQNLAIAAGAVGMAGREGDIFRKVVGWSLLFLVLMCALVFLQTTVLEWMLP